MHGKIEAIASAAEPSLRLAHYREILRGSPLANDDVAPNLRERLSVPLLVVEDLLRIHLPEQPVGRRAGAMPYQSKRSTYEPR